MSALCVIPARGGSKRIPRKNIKEFCGKPMIAYSIEAAKKTGIFDHVVVSTDDEEIADVALKYGAEVPFMRPAEISDDVSGLQSVVSHSIKAAEGYYQEVQENICCLLATAPFVTSDFITESYNKLQSDGDFIIPVTSYVFPIQRAVKCFEGRLIPFSEKNMLKRSQDLEEAYHDAGQFYWGKRFAWLSDKSLWFQKVLPYIVPRTHVQDIDTFEDWDMAELMFEALKMKDRVA